MENPEVAQVFEEIADLLEIQGANPFRVRAYRNAAREIRDLSSRLADTPREALSGLPGIGKDLAGKIGELLDTGDLSMRRELREQVPPGLRDMLGLPGLGPKRALALHQELRLTSLDELREAAEQHRIREVTGFAARSEEKILKALEDKKQTGRRVLLAEAKVFAEAVVLHLRQTPGVERVDVAGSFRRRRETVGDLDVLVAGSRAGPVMDRLAEFEAVAEVTARGRTRMSVRLRNGLQLDLRVVPETSYGAALAYFTGSKAHSILVRRRAQERGLKINEYGVFRGARRLAGRTEQDVYQAVGLPWIPPELREARGEIERAAEGRLPELVTLEDLRGDLHVHTSATDGRASLEAMADAARKRGHQYIAITDHSQRVAMARGLDARRLREQWTAIDDLAGRIRGLTILKGVEVDILEDGRLDLPDEVLKEADWVVAAIHYGQKQPRARITERLLQAIRHPHVHALAHPTGRLIGKRKAYDMDLEAVLRAAAGAGCLLELNAQPERLDLDDVALMAAREHGVRIVVSTDAHSAEELGLLEFGVDQARRAGLEAGDVANTRTLAQFRKLLKRSSRGILPRARPSPM